MDSEGPEYHCGDKNIMWPVRPVSVLFFFFFFITRAICELWPFALLKHYGDNNAHVQAGDESKCTNTETRNYCQGEDKEADYDDSDKEQSW